MCSVEHVETELLRYHVIAFTFCYNQTRVTPLCDFHYIQLLSTQHTPKYSVINKHNTYVHALYLVTKIKCVV